MYLPNQWVFITYFPRNGWISLACLPRYGSTFWHIPLVESSGDLSYLVWAYGVVVSMFDFHRNDRGSYPGRGGKIS